MARGLAAALLLLSGVAHAEVADRVLEAVRRARLDAGVGALERTAELDAIARTHAAQVASLPHDRRLTAAEDFGKELREAGIRYARVSWHLDFNRGYTDPAAAFGRSWSRYEQGWSSALNEVYDHIGIASVRADDGWIVLVAILVQERVPVGLPAPGDLEAATLAAANEARRERGFPALRADPTLAEVARAHSRDMIRRRFFDHRSPDGAGPEERVRERGLRFARIAENVHRNRGMSNPVATAVQAWLDSPGHRAMLLSPEFTETAVGVAIDGEGTVYFTQLFLRPPGPGRSQR